MVRALLTLLVALALSACAGGGGLGGLGGFGYYDLVRPQSTVVARGAMTVTPTVPWNRAPRGQYDISREENWTLNGPYLDSLAFIGGVQDDDRIVRERRTADRQVPKFRSNMTPPELTGMIESYYRIRGGTSEFTMTNLQPRQFLGHPGFQFDYDHLSGDEVERRGRAVGAIIGGRFYLALFDAAKMHYFDAGLPEFERIVESARLRG